MPGVAWRRACDARTKSARLVNTQTETAGVPLSGATGGFKSVKTTGALTRSASRGLWHGDCSESCGRPLWPCVREIRDGSCEPGLMVGTCASSRALRFMAKSKQGIRSRMTFQTRPLEGVAIHVNAKPGVKLQQLPHLSCLKCFNHHGVTP